MGEIYNNKVYKNIFETFDGKYNTEGKGIETVFICDMHTKEVIFESTHAPVYLNDSLRRTKLVDGKLVSI